MSLCMDIAVDDQTFQQMPRMLLTQLDPEERKQFLLQIKDKFQNALLEVETELFELESE